MIFWNFVVSGSVALDVCADCADEGVLVLGYNIEDFVGRRRSVCATRVEDFDARVGIAIARGNADLQLVVVGSQDTEVKDGRVEVTRAAIEDVSKQSTEFATTNLGVFHVCVENVLACSG